MKCKHGYGEGSDIDCPKCASARERTLKKWRERREKRDQFAAVIANCYSSTVFEKRDSEEFADICFDIAEAMLEVSEERAEADAERREIDNS